jgi:hypothetical protein
VIYANISSDGGTFDLEAEDLEPLAAQLPADWRGTARARNTRGFVVGYIGRDARGVATWRYA